MNLDKNYNEKTKLSEWWKQVDGNFKQIEINYATETNPGWVTLHQGGSGNNSGLLVGSKGELTVNVPTTDPKYGLKRDGSGNIKIDAATAAEVTAGTNAYKPITPATLKTVKTEITNAYKAAINAIPTADTDNFGLVKLAARGGISNGGGLTVNTNTEYGTSRTGDGKVVIAAATDTEVEAGTQAYKPIVPKTLKTVRDKITADYTEADAAIKNNTVLCLDTKLSKTEGTSIAYDTAKKQYTITAPKSDQRYLWKEPYGCTAIEIKNMVYNNVSYSGTISITLKKGYTYILKTTNQPIQQGGKYINLIGVEIELPPDITEKLDKCITDDNFADHNPTAAYASLDELAADTMDARAYANNLMDYSETPRKIGTWIDGTPVWRMAFKYKFDEIDIKDIENDNQFYIVNFVAEKLNTPNGIILNYTVTLAVDIDSPCFIDDITLAIDGTFGGAVKIDKSMWSGNSSANPGIYGYIEFVTPADNIKNN